MGSSSNDNAEKREETSTVEDDFNLSSELCVICRDKSCEYRCIPCHHVCFCSDCVSEFAEKVEDEEMLGLVGEDSEFFTQKPEIFSFDKILVNNSCPICRLQVQKLEYYQPIVKTHVMERNTLKRDEFHSDGLLMASNEIFKLGLHVRERPEIMEKLTHCRGHFE